MDSRPSACPKCNGEMVQGFMPQHIYGAGLQLGQWVEGLPQKSFWSGLSMRRRQSIPIGAYRCKSCGFLEAYARYEFVAK